MTVRIRFVAPGPLEGWEGEVDSSDLSSLSGQYAELIIVRLDMGGEVYARRHEFARIDPVVTVRQEIIDRGVPAFATLFTMTCSSVSPAMG